MGRIAATLASVVLALAGISWPIVTAHAGERVHLPYTTTKLANGLEVIVHENHRSPIVTVNVMYHVGARDDPEGRRGFAHLFEHVMFAGSQHVAPGQFLALLDNAGATDLNAETDPDWTTYHETVPANQLELALWLESDRMGFLVNGLDQGRFDNARQVVARERQQRVLNVPGGRVYEMIMGTLFPPGHPYHALGLAESLDSATLDEARAFFDTFYAPNNATIVLSGDIDKAQALALVERYFGPIPSGRAPTQHTASAERLEMPSRIDVEANVPRRACTFRGSRRRSSSRATPSSI
jgi:predicted Zn-dependent peptidase